mgnify:CR=1 FL=1
MILVNCWHDCIVFIQSVEVVNNLFQTVIQDYTFSLRGNNSVLYTHVEEMSNYRMPLAWVMWDVECHIMVAKCIKTKGLMSNTWFTTYFWGPYQRLFLHGLVCKAIEIPKIPLIILNYDVLQVRLSSWALPCPINYYRHYLATSHRQKELITSNFVQLCTILVPL